MYAESDVCDSLSIQRNRLEADPAILNAGIVDRPPEYLLAASADVRQIQTQGFQTLFELFQGEVILGQHDRVPFVR